VTFAAEATPDEKAELPTATIVVTGSKTNTTKQRRAVRLRAPTGKCNDVAEVFLTPVLLSPEVPSY
jgi:hypothetical protein